MLTARLILFFRSLFSENHSSLSILFCIFLLSHFLLYSISNPAIAANDSQPSITRLDPFVIHGNQDRLFGSSKKELERQPSSVGIISDEEVGEGRGFNFEDIFQFSPGVYYQTKAGGNDGQFSIRGTNLSTNFNQWGVTILLNGLPMNTADGFFTFEAVDLLSVERIEVYKGANALRFGGNTIGGAVNFIMKNGAKAARFQVRGEAGSYGFYNSQLSSGNFSEPFHLYGKSAIADYYVSLTAGGQHGFRSNNQEADIRLTTNVGLQLGSNQLIRLSVFNSSTSSDLPGPHNRAQLDAIPTQAGVVPDVAVSPIACQAAEPCQHAEFSEVHRIGLAYQLQITSDQAFLFAPFFQYWLLDENLAQEFLEIHRDFGADFRFNMQHLFGGIPHRLVVGWSPRFGETSTQVFANNFGNRGVILQERFVQAVTWSGYWESQFDLSQRLTLILGARLEHQTRDGSVRVFTGGIASSLRLGSRTFNAVSPKLGFVYRTTSTSQLYGNVSRVYEPPININLIQFVNSSGIPPTEAFIGIDAQRGWQFELGHRGTAWNGDAMWDITVFDLELRKEVLVTELTIPGFGEVPTYRNANGTRHTGVEAGGQIVLLRGLLATAAPSFSPSSSDQVRARAAYTWSRYRFTDDVFKTSGGARVIDAQDGKTIPGVPEHWLTGELRYDHPNGFWVAPNIQWAITGYFVDYVNIAQAPSFFVVNLKGGYQINQQWKVFFEGRNLNDQNYAGAVAAGGFNTSPTLQPRAFFPAWPISFFGGVEFVLQ